MVDRYQRQIQEQGAPNVALQNTATPQAYGVGIGQEVSQLGQQAMAVSNVLLAYKEKQDKIDVLAATNDYNRRMTAYLSDPENGQINVRKLGDAKGLLMDTETHADTLVKEITPKLSKEAASLFSLSEAQLRSAYTKTAATHEAKERETYRKAVTESTLQGFLTSVQSDPLNQELKDAMIDQGIVIIADNMPGADQQSIDNAISAWRSKLDEASIEQFISSDPLLAKRLIDESTSLLPKTKVDLEAKVKPEVEKVEVQGIVDEITAKFGWDDVAGVSKYVRNTYEGTRQDQIMTRYKTQYHELKIAENHASEFTAKQQKQNFQTDFYEIYVMNNLPIPVDELDNAVRSGRIGMTQREAGLTYNARTATRSSIATSVKRKNPTAWNAMTDLQKEEAVMKGAGITADRRQNALEYLQQAIVDPESQITNADIDAYYQGMLITAGERDNAKKILSMRTGELNNVISTQTSRMNNDIKILLPEDAFWGKEARSRYIDQAKIMFLNKVYEAQEMGLKGEELHKYLNNERRSIVSEIGTKIMGDNMVILRNNTAFFSNVNSIMERIGREEMQTKAPTFRADDIKLPGGIQDVSIPTNGSLTMSMVENARYVSDDYYAPRDGGSRQHQALDIAANEGSSIYMGDFGAEMSVSKVYSSDNGGNTVELTGKMKNGKTVEVRMLHLKSLEGLRKGESFNVGDLVGFVGNTGKASTGPHLHIEVSVDGKRVNPEDHLKVISEMRMTEQEEFAKKSNITKSDKQVKAEPKQPPAPKPTVTLAGPVPYESSITPENVVIQDSTGSMTLEEMERKFWGELFDGE